ncbi:MAG TPA: cation:proton antiporter [Gammaproteobacteria bacterium]|nr:cation:proton antiporter [Gammaproteobacteria bacterium]
MQALIGIFCIWLTSRLLGAVARRLKQPAIIGELFAGVLLGPSLIGHYYSFTSPILTALNLFGTALFLLTAGWEIRLSEVLHYRRLGLAVSAAGALVPFLIGYGLGSGWPAVVGYDGLSPAPMFALFLGIALSVSALPVIARTLMDMGLYRTRIGIITMSAVTIDDLLGWICFSLMLSLFGGIGAGAQFNFFLPLVCYAGGVLIGELGDSKYARVKTGVNRLVSDVLAPVVFGSTALKLSFIQNFDLTLALVLILAASAGKILGCALAALALRLPRQEAWAVGFAMNSRGAMMIILSSLAWQLHVIGDRLLVGLITMAVVTSLMSAPLIRRALAGSTPAPD